MYEIFLNGVKKISIQNKSPRRYNNVKVYVGDPWYPHMGNPRGAWLRDLKIMTGKDSSVAGKLHPGI